MLLLNIYLKPFREEYLQLQLKASRDYIFSNINYYLQNVCLSQWFPTFMRLGSTCKSKTNLGSTLMAKINFWEHF
jgi:hypothetical protein